MDDVRPRQIRRTTRYGIAAGLVLVIAVALALTSSSDAAGWVALVALTVGSFFFAMTVSNVGFSPRIRRRFLEVSTVLGRQSLDLTALRGARLERGRHGGNLLRLRDDLTDVCFSASAVPLIAAELREALVLAGQRGIAFPDRVTNLLNLPPAPGAPRNGFNTAPLFLFGAYVVGIAVAVVVVD